jgi:uncharacterized protein
MIRLNLAAAAGVFAAAHPVSAQELRPAAVPVEGTILDISAEGVATRTPDLAIIEAGVVTQAGTASAALGDNGARMARVLAALKRAGIAERDVQTASINLSPQYRYAENQPPVITGYQASNQVTVRFRDIGRAGAVLDALVQEGANNISGPNLTLEKPEAALDEASTAAVAKARARAELYARAAGLRIDRILAISESGAAAPPMPPMPMMVRMEAADAATKVLPGQRDLSVTLSVRFLLK